MNADRAEAALWAASLRNRNVEAGTADDGALPVAGGYALCVGGTAIAHALAAGSTRALREDDCAIVEEFYRARALPARFALTEDTLARDGALLATRGYLEEGGSLAVWEGAAASMAGTDAVTVRPTTDRGSWCTLGVRAAAEPGVDAERLRRTLDAYAAAYPLLVVATCAGEPVGGAALGISAEFGLLAAAAVLPPFRGRGVYRALLAARLALAREHGATRIALTAPPGSPAERSAAQAGLTRAATRRMLRAGG